MKLLALDSSTDTVSLAVQSGKMIHAHTAPGGALASSYLIAAIERLMQQAGLHYAQLDALVFGCGPGSFTGLRTACSVVQGLAFGAKRQVLPVNTLQALAEEGRIQADKMGLDTSRILACLDARMGEVYVNCFESGRVQGSLGAGMLVKPQALLALQHPSASLLVGNIRPSLDAQLSPDALALPYLNCQPTAQALLQLAPDLMAAGGLVEPEQALPLYIRNKVALTTSEREAQQIPRPVRPADGS